MIGLGCLILFREVFYYKRITEDPIYDAKSQVADRIKFFIDKKFTSLHNINMHPCQAIGLFITNRCQT